MNWYYVDAGQQAGPVDDAQLQGLVAAGKITPDTLVWHEGMTAWAAYRTVAPAGGAPGGAAPAPDAPPLIAPAAGGAGGSVICSECGKAFAPSDVIRYADKFVCANCKPLFFQRLREGATPGTGAGAAGAASEADLLARDYEADIGGCLSRSWELFKANAGIMIGATILVYLVVIAVNGIPYLNSVLGLIFNGPLMGGLWLFYIKKVRNQDASVGDAFGGFGPRFGQLLLTQLIPGLIAVALFMVFGALALPAIIMSSRQTSGGPSTTLWITLGTLIPLAFAVYTYITVCWLFALPLVADKGLNFWPALELSRRVVNKHWWMTFWLVVVSGVLGLVGVLVCCFGALVTFPVAFGMLSYHFEKVFGDLAKQA